MNNTHCVSHLLAKMEELKNISEDAESRLASMPSVSFNSAFKIIDELNESTKALCSAPDYNVFDKEVHIVKLDSGGFIINIEGIVADISKPYDIELQIGDRKYLIKNFFLSMRSTQLIRQQESQHLSGKLKFTGHVDELQLKGGLKKSAFNRFIIPTGVSQLDYYINTSGFRDGDFMNARGRVTVTVNGKEFILYEKQRNKKYYFIIDSLQQVDEEEFSDICHSIMLGFGFLSANFIQNEGYYFKSSDEEHENIIDFSYWQLRPSINSNGTCNPIYSNPYGYTKDEEVIKKVGFPLTVFDDALFSKLCNKIHCEENYTTLILLIIESNVSSLILRPAGYAVALEKITNIIVEENKGLKPIPDKVLAKSFGKSLKKVLEEFTDKIKETGNTDSITILTKNIDKINNPTNRDKLVKPFEILAIKLNEADLAAIDNRNNFLHGRKIKVDDNSVSDLKVYEISLRLNKVINKLILKHIGYSGLTINHLKHNENSFDHEIEEALFEQL